MTMIHRVRCYLGRHAWEQLPRATFTTSGTHIPRTVIAVWKCKHCDVGKVTRTPYGGQLRTPPRQVRPEYIKQVRR